jgi:hypothetical protein
MSAGAPLQTAAVKPLQAARANPFLQRKCACGGGASGLTGECEECSKKKMVGLQTNLRINEPGDAYEQEADRIAEQVLAKPVHPGISGAPPRVQRYTGQATRQVDATPASVDRVLANPGRPLDPALRQDMEQRFGHDFFRVRLHFDGAAGQSAQHLNANAYTVGHDIVFGAGRFAPGTREGRRLIAHELAHVVQQHGAHSMIQRQPTKDAEKTKFDFMLGDVEGRPHVLAVIRPTDPADFLKAFQEKGDELNDAQFTWLSNNLIKFTADAVLKQKRNPYANISLETLRDVAARAHEKVVAALVARATTEAGAAIVKLIYISKKVIYVGKTAGKFASRFGGFLAWIGSALVQLLIGPLFDKTAALVKQAVDQFAEAMQKVVSEVIIPKVRISATSFDRFMASLGTYLLQDTDEPKQKSTPTPGPAFSVGEGDYEVKVGIDTTVPLTDQKRDQIIIDLANVVLGIDEVVPRLKTDLSLYNDLAQRTGVFSGDVAKASAPATAPPSGKPAAAYDKHFEVTRMVVGDSKFDVPSGGSVAVTSEAHYTDPDWKLLKEDSRPPSSYRIDLYKGKGAVKPTKEYLVDKSETGTWYNLDGGQYYLVIDKGGDPTFTLQGNLHIEIRNP